MKLEWKDTESEQMSWYEAKKLESNGWRLPTRVELIHAFDSKVEGFTSVCWSSNNYILDTKYAWSINFNYGGMGTDDKECCYYVRLCKEVEE
jgi:hypothetical protein